MMVCAIGVLSGGARRCFVGTGRQNYTALATRLNRRLHHGWQGGLT
jgi:hypothetical protein